MELQAAAIDFHTAPHYDARSSTDLGQDVERIALRLQACPLKELELPLTRVIAIRQRITGQNVDLSDFASQPADSQIIVEIRNAITDAMMFLERRREEIWA